MAAEPQRVVVIQDASREVCAKAIKMALRQMDLRPGDELTITAILDRFNSPMGYKIRVDTSSFVATTNKVVEEELVRKYEDIRNSAQIMKLSKYCEQRKMVFHIEVVARPFLEVASNAAKSSGATWLIIDRQVNKEKKQLDRLRCGMYRIRSDNSIQKLKDPDGKTENTKSFTASQAHFRYDEMIPGNLDEELSPKRSKSSPSEQFTSIGTSSIFSTEASSSSTYQLMRHKEQETAGIFQISYCDEQHGSVNEVSQMEAEFTEPLCSVCKNKRPKVGLKKDFTFAELHTATQGFSQKNFLSEGGFGSVYKGELNGITIAVKQHKNASLQGEKEFKSEVNLLSRARHENVVMLLGSCSEGNRRLLVYEYVCNGSLDQHLSQHSRTPLSWEERIKVAVGAANGLLYLHENNIIHRDMRPNNILITHDHQPLLGDFGLARNQHEDSIQSTEVVGTLGYLAPEYAEYGKVSAKTDVYSFGVVLLQLITGVRTTDKRLGGRSLVGWARPLLRERNYPDLIDERIMNSNDFLQLFWMVRIAEKCLSRDPQKRLNMVAVVNALSRIVEGNTCGIMIRDFSPARSDSSYSSSGMGESRGDDEQESIELEGVLDSLSTDSTWSSSLNMMSQMIVRLPPSPPVKTTSSSTSMVCDKSSVESNEDQNKRNRDMSESSNE